MRKDTLTKKSYTTLAALAGAAIIAAIPAAASATPTYIDVSALGNVSLDVDLDTFTGLATSWVDETNTPHNIEALFSLTYADDSKHFAITAGSDTLLAGDIDPLVAWFDMNEDQAWGDGDYFEFTFASGSGLLNGNASWPGIVTIDLGAGNHYGNADIIAAAPANPVPEPATMSLMLFGGSALAAIRRRTRPTTA